MQHSRIELNGYGQVKSSHEEDEEGQGGRVDYRGLSMKSRGIGHGWYGVKVRQRHKRTTRHQT